ncbi:AzlD domain-containing protein [Frankia sp. AgKG'84/4]|uniref:AzlD domain-containing protein n=1 Tax=Frankia sp. AgKG'84/4 TaxID=573490 RepID=UPI00200E1E15|nr:AzlD domain-containing protein [Frankia sp. AgKG'84/4]MCL9794526.1 AzlD domain-containing protein [Frankia sp. AgKG'84/4]
MSWSWLLAGAAACLLLKVVGLVTPRRILDHPPVTRLTEAMPVALLGALIVVQTLTTGQHLVLDARLAGLAIAAGCVRLRAPFPIVIIMSALGTAALRALGHAA